MITDEIVEKAAKALATHWRNRGVEQGWPGYQAEARDALESVLPDLLSAARAEGMEEVLELIKTPGVTSEDFHWLQELELCNAIRARISSVKPKTTDEAKP